MTNKEYKVLRSLKNNLALLAVLFLCLFAYKAVTSTELSSTASASEVKEVNLDFSTLNIDIPAKAFTVFDPLTGDVLLSKNETTQLPVASVTKLVTAVVVNENLTDDATVIITEGDVATYGRAGKLEVGQQYTNRELLFPLLIESSNDAATSLQRSFDGSLVNDMNAYVKTINANNTNFADPSGLSSHNISTASDLAIILTNVYRQYPYILDITKLSKYIGDYSGWVNNNPIIGEDYQGGKHGYTNAAGKTVLALFTEEFAGEKKTFGYVVLGSNDIKTDMSTLREAVRQAVMTK